MLQAFGARQQEILRLLLRAKDGLTIDDILATVQVTRTAVVMHLASFERDGYLVRGNPTATGGRPSQVFRLSARGIDLFPKQYSWFSALLLEALAGQLGEDGLTRFLEGLAHKIAAEYEPQLKDLAPAQRMKAIVAVMNELAFDADLAYQRGSREPVIRASNCIYHHLAAQHPEVCSFDRALLARLSGSVVNQTECIIKGGVVCKFQFGPAPRKDEPWVRKRPI